MTTNQAHTPPASPSIEYLPLRSTNSNTISALLPLARSLLMAELSMISYLPEEETRHLATTKLGFDEVVFYEQDGSQAYSFINATDHVIACRGTEPNEWNDVKADLDAQTALAETVGRVHRGFKKEVDDIWPILEKALTNNKANLWFTGHSLGGAMATICAGRCFLSHISSRPEQIQTFGSPRVGNKRYVNNVNIDYLRWVNNNDIVTRVPPAWLGYRHTGTMMYLNSEGKITNPNPVQLNQDRWKGFVMGLKEGKIDHFIDHLIDNYVEYIYQEAVAAGEVSAATAVST